MREMKFMIPMHGLLLTILTPKPHLLGYANQMPLLPNRNPKTLTLSQAPPIFIQHNVLPVGGHRSEPFYFDLWLVDCILCGRKVNLGYLMVQQMSNLLTSAHGILPYGMILTTLFRACHIDLSTKTDVRMPKPSDAINNACTTRLGYEYIEGKQLEKGSHVPAALDYEIDEDAETNVPPPSPQHLHLFHLALSHPLSVLSGTLIYHSRLTALVLTCELSLRITLITLTPLRLSKPPCLSFCDFSFHLHRLSSCFIYFYFDVL